MVAVSRLAAERQHPAHPDPVDPRRPRGRGRPAAVPAATTWAARCSTGACCPRPASSTASNCRWRMPRASPRACSGPFRQRTTDYREPQPTATAPMTPRSRSRSSAPGFAGLGMAMALRRAGPRRLRRPRARGIRRRNLARQHLPGRRVRRALAPLRLRRRTRTRTWSGTYARGDEIRVVPRAHRRRRGARATGCGCARRCDGPTGMPPTGCGASAPALRRRGSRRRRRRHRRRRARARLRTAHRAVDSPDRRPRELPRAAVPLGPLGSLRRPRGRARRRRRHGGERGPDRARTGAHGGARHPVPAHAGVDRAAGRRRVLRRRPRPVRGDPAGSRGAARRPVRRGRGALRVAVRRLPLPRPRREAVGARAPRTRRSPTRRCAPRSRRTTRSAASACCCRTTSTRPWRRTP